jgi:hypothetical protein
LLPRLDPALVSHDGGDNNGHFAYTLNATDIATGWTEAITVRSKGERIVSAGLDQLRLAFPFAVLGVHSDNRQPGRIQLVVATPRHGRC